MLVQRDLEQTTVALVASPRVTPTLESRRKWQRRVRRWLRITDHAIVIAAVVVAILLQWSTTSPVTSHTLLAAAMLVALWSFFLAGMRSRANGCLGSGAVEYQRVAHATGLAFGGVAIWALLVGWEGDRLLIFTSVPLGLSALLISRWRWRCWLRTQRRSGQYCPRALIVGERTDVAYVANALAAKDTGFNVVGVTLIGADRRPVEAAGRQIPVQGTLEQVKESALAIQADTIVIATTPDKQPHFVRDLSWRLEGAAANLLLSNGITDVVGPRVSFRPVDGLPMLQIRIPSYEGGHYLLKRGLDITVAAVALFAIALVTPVIALAIKLDSSGPVFYSQLRVGKDGRHFRMFKFRTMRQNAEREQRKLQNLNEGAGVLFKLRNDPRVTRVGGVLRRLSVDELPQFWNVLRGEMSVVGPRPPMPREVEAYDGEVVRRLYVKPGITGPWQVGGRSDLSWEDSVRLDLRYVENWSVMNDLQLIWRTARVVARREGAY